MNILPWKLFEKTGNLEAYLLMKQVEELDENEDTTENAEQQSVSQLEPR